MEKKYRLLFPDTKEYLSFNAPDANGYVIGRTDDISDFIPDLDLAPFEAKTRGVSRRHAAFVVYQGEICLVDLNSANGSFINESRLKVDKVYPVSIGDQLQFGSLSVFLQNVV